MVSENETFDLVIVGSGGGGIVAALAAADVGLKPVIIEKQSVIGGSTAMSGGIIWIPDNPLMRAEGISDSYQDGLKYFESVVGPPDQGSSMERREAFLRYGPEMLSFIQGKGVRLVRCEGYSDYYDNRPGGNARGRAVEGVPWDGRQLGAWQDKINPGMARSIGMAVMTNEVRNLPVWNRSWKSFQTTLRVMARTLLSARRGEDLLTNGMSLVGQLTKILVDAGIPVWLDTGVEELIVEDGRVVGVRANRNGLPVVVRGERGVLLSAGGFERNPEMRMKFSAETQPSDGTWTMANMGNTGEVLSAAIALGAKTDYMDEAVWNPTARWELGSGLAVARQYARSMYVNKHGRRFCNESNSYVEVTKAMYANDAVPAWLIFDDHFRRNRVWAQGMPKLREFTSVLPGRMPAEFVSKGWIKKADSIEGLAGQIGVDPATLATTVQYFNQHAVRGLDPEFHRGESQYNRVLGDPGSKVNPAVGPVDNPPYYATEIYAGDVGTSGGVVTNEYAQVLDQADQAIPGLYATGNMTATVMGRFYLGAGASIANTTVFGYVAARHAAGRIEATSTV
ncbi:MAG: FAD-binding protein [Acidimicrobiales bacterium]|jgi:3-oxosteroid 1-dehydrogenase